MNDAMNPQPPTLEQPPVQEAPHVSGEVQELVKKFHSGAGWFYFVAALSMVNTVLMAAGVQWAFFFGLGITQVIDAIAMGIAEGIGGGPAVWIVRIIAVAFDLGIAGFFILFGWLSKRGYGIAYIFGIILFMLDALIFLVASDWPGLFFHAIALVGMIMGYGALRKLRALQAQQPVLE